MFGHWDVFFPPGLPADEMLLLDRFFHLTLKNGEETAEERLEIIRQINRGSNEEQMMGEGGGEDRRMTAAEARAAAAAAASASAGGKKKGNGERKLKKEEPEEEEEEEEEEEKEGGDEDTVSLPVKRAAAAAAAKKRPAKPTELEVVVLKAVLAEGGVADMQAIHKNAAELLGIAKYRTGSINCSVTRAVGKGLLTSAEEEVKKEEGKQEVKEEEGVKKEGGEEEGEEVEVEVEEGG